MRTVLSFIVAATLLAVAGCGSDPSEDGSTSVVASTTQLADLARNVAGERAAVTGLLSPTSDPHDFEPRPSDAEALAGADLILQSGGDLDLWLEQIVESSGTEAPVLIALDRVPAPSGDELDPHWWQDPRLAIAAVEAIRDELIAVDPDGASIYEDNAAAYIGRIEDLDSAIARCMKGIPEPQRKLVTTHDALGYFADRYGIEVIGAAIPALSTQAQPSAGETAELVELIRDTGREDDLPRGGREPRARGGDRRRGRRQRRRRALGGCARPRRQRRPDLPRGDGEQRFEAGRRLRRIGLFGRGGLNGRHGSAQAAALAQRGQRPRRITS